MGASLMPAQLQCPWLHRLPPSLNQGNQALVQRAELCRICFGCVV